MLSARNRNLVAIGVATAVGLVLASLYYLGRREASPGWVVLILLVAAAVGILAYKKFTSSKGV